MITLIIGNKNYSSWSLRSWLILKELSLEFDEVVLKLFTNDFNDRIGDFSPAKQVPVLHHGEHVIWDSLSIAEFLNDNYPDKNLWPEETKARIFARTISAEMHSGFYSLRQNMPMNCRARNREVSIDVALQNDIDRIIQIWSKCRELYSPEGKWLFGDFSIADAMYAPVAFRFVTYQVKLPKLAQNYCDFLLSRPAMQVWEKASIAEKEIIAAGEVGK